MQTSDRRLFLQGSVAAAAAAFTVPAVARAAATQPAVQAPEKVAAGCKTKFAVNIEMWGFGKGSLHERVYEVAKLGFPAVEFWPWRGRDLDALVKACKETKTEITQFTAWGFVPGMNDPKNHDAVVKEIQASCETAE